MKRKILIAGSIVLLSLVAVGVALAFGVGSVDGVWQYVEDGSGATCDNWASITGTSFPWSTTDPGIQSSDGYLTDENQVRYGIPTGYEYCPGTQTGFLLQSGFGFDGINGPLTGITVAEEFYVGSFMHYNHPIYAASNPMDWVDLTVTVPVDCDDDGNTDTTFTIVPRFYLDETPNAADPCPYLPGDPVNVNGCADAVDVVQPENPTFTCNETLYTVNILGFTTNENCETVFDADASTTQFITKEDASNHACLWANIDASAVDAGVTKQCDGFDTQGLDAHYIITVVNYGPGTALGAIIVDTLPSGVTYAGFTSQRTVNSVTTTEGTCSAVGQLVTCDLNASLPEMISDPTAKWVVDLDVDYAQVGDPQWLNTVTLTTTSEDVNPANDTGSAICSPTVVELKSFTAAWDNGSVALSWETTSETDNLGFNVYRSKTIDGKKKKINEGLIPTLVYPGSLEGAFYSFSDNNAKAGVTYYYWVEDVDVYGRTTLHGPVEVLGMWMNNYQVTVPDALKKLFRGPVDIRWRSR